MESSLLSAALGAVIGALLAVTGAGGGILAVPLLVFGLNMSVAQAAPIGLIAVGVSSAAGALMGLREGLVRYRAAIFIGLLGMAVAPIGVAVASRVPNPPLMIAFSLVLVISAWRTVAKAWGWGGAVHSGERRTPPCMTDLRRGRLIWIPSCTRTLAVIGAISGFTSGLLGVGGGFVIVPALNRYTNLSAHSILVTSLAVIAMVSTGGIAAWAVQGHVEWRLALPFALGAVIAMLAGRRVAANSTPAHLQTLFAIICTIVACLLFWRAMVSI